MKYIKVEEKYIKEIESNVIVYRHLKTNARIVTLKNDDDNKVFTIGFRTPPINNTGLTHILEHSVLCGSKKYPIKDPFVELIKGSLNTFLNAMTYPDKTVYPIASRNLKDFHNLMDVYLDAVFYPNIYNKKEIFMQEGWHYELLNENDPIIYNGVVYNEMKGAFSDPSQVLFRRIMHSLYPDTAYGFESGGDPKYIPDLDYEEFKKFHSEYYHPSNSYIYLYGNLDMDYELEYLDNEYLSKFDKIDFDTTIYNQKPFDKPLSFDYYYQAEDLNKKAFLSYNVALTDPNPKLLIAMNILLDAIFNTPGAVLKEALIKAKIADDVDVTFETELKQPMLMIVAVNAYEDKMDTFKKIIDTKLKELLKNGLDKKGILSLITYAEFKAREAGFSARTPKGLNIILSSFSSYLYDDNMPYSNLEVIKYYDELKNDLNNGYFEKIIEEYILNNNHKTYVRLIPKLDYSQEENNIVIKKLKEYKDKLSKEELKKLVEENINLKKYQDEEDKKEDILKLPKLKKEDIEKYSEDYNLEVIDDKYKILFSNYNTNEIGYARLYFDITNIDINMAKYLALYTDILFDISTKGHSYLEINQLIQELTGGMSASLYMTKDIDNKPIMKLIYSFSALNKNFGKVFNLLNEVISDTLFNDKDRIKEKLLEIKANLDMHLLSDGHRTAATYAKAGMDEIAYYDDNTKGIMYADFISDIISSFDKKIDDVINNLISINKLLSKKNFIFGFVGDKSSLDIIKNNVDSFYNNLNEDFKYDTFNYKEYKVSVGFKCPINVSYNALCAKYDYKFNGGMLVLTNAINMQYLWFRVRVKGGAYGVFSSIYQDKCLVFTSYRDPNVKNTYDAYIDTPKFIEEFNPNEEELLNYIIGTIANISPVLHVKNKGISAFANYFRKNTIDIRNKVRNEIINVTLDDIKSYKELYLNALNNYNNVTLSSDNNIEENKNLFDTIRNIKK